MRTPDGIDVCAGKRPVLLRLLDGRTEKEIAASLNLTVDTVHGEVRSLYRMFGVRSRAELIAKAYVNAISHLTTPLVLETVQ